MRRRVSLVVATMLLACGGDEPLVAQSSAISAGGNGGGSSSLGTGGNTGTTGGSSGSSGAVDAPITPNDLAFVPPDGSCSPVDLDAPLTFSACTQGSGSFGAWTVDAFGLPAYDYGLDEQADSRASFFNTEKLDRRDHWASFGNGRVTALAYNDGYVELTTQDRGITYLNKLDESQGAYAGGFSFIDDGTETWSTAYKWRPANTGTHRRFGINYAEYSLTHREIEVTRRLSAPRVPDAAPLVIDDVTLVNHTAFPRTIRHYEYWDVMRRQISINWVVSGIPFASIPEAARQARDAQNAAFDEQPTWDSAGKILGIRRTAAAGSTPPTIDTPSPTDSYPGDPFVAALVGDVADVYTDQNIFFGAGGPSQPDAVSSKANGAGLSNTTIGSAQNGMGQPLMLVLRSDVALAPGESKSLRFAFGTTPMGTPFTIDDSLRDPATNVAAAADQKLAPNLVYFAPSSDPVLHREMAWHSAALEASVAYRDYWQARVVPQGSAYLYLHGADGAARDLALFAVPLTYTDPSLASDELRIMMGMQLASDHSFVYALQGHGMLDDGMGFHSHPSDLDIFFLFALAEYVGATGDEAFLDSIAPYYPRESLPNATVFNHLSDSVHHLFDDVGTGQHGLLRILSGDWNDGIDLDAPDRSTAIAKGESVPNTQMAIAILPRVSDLVATRDPMLSQLIRDHVTALQSALSIAWTGSYYGRAYFGDDNLDDKSTCILEPQVWPLIGDEPATMADATSLLSSVETTLDDPSPTGAMLSANGQVWPAISGLLTWGYSKFDEPRAWNHLVRNTLSAHATAFPDLWVGIWSGPDGLSSSSGDRPGGAWYSQVTPMTDFPVLNANQHAMPLLAMLRVSGIEATANGLAITPRTAGHDFALRTQLVDLDLRGSSLHVAYRPMSARSLLLHAPAGKTITQASAGTIASDGSTVNVDVPATGIDVTVELDH